MRRRLFKNLVTAPCTEPVPAGGAALESAGAALAGAVARRLGRSLAIRELDAGSCNGCELEIHALGNAFYDIERFGVRFVASPRHADLLLVTGPVTLNMREALERTYAAMPAPKWVVAAGDCAAGCGVFAGSYACAGSVAAVVPVDLAIPGCPPTPVQLLHGLLRLLARDQARDTAQPR
ncbi:MAG TPA: NADH-quinone oxidoreductase subunit NuoB [Steroidobacteraceae bacterium]|nr:NADH-quinone oxidoreductase subunit NuoB [Steroidobacteraceae bacterium]